MIKGRYMVVKITDHPCSECGTKGAHFCTGKRRGETIEYVGKRAPFPKREVVDEPKPS